MSHTLLFDLDNTLLENDLDIFLPAYFQIWREFVAPFAHPDRFIKAVLQSTRKMIENRRPDCTLREIFLESLLPTLGMSEEQFDNISNQFYEQEFPKLKPLTRPRPGAIDLVENALAGGYQISLATNPIFPISAILQRLEWAGLPAERYPFLVIPSLEIFHYAKPNPAFFAEVLSYMGWPDGPVVMIGDDFKQDIAPAEAAGLKVFWVNQSNGREQKPESGVASQGDLHQVLNWLEEDPIDPSQIDQISPSALMATLLATPAAVDNFCRNLSASEWQAQPRPGEWSPLEIVCHLRDVDTELNLPRLVKVLSEENPFIPGVDTDQWAVQRDYNHQNGPLSLSQYISTRTKLLELLESFSDKDWLLPSRHALFGRTDVQDLVKFIALHDRQHIRQFLQDIHPNRLKT